MPVPPRPATEIVQQAPAAPVKAPQSAASAYNHSDPVYGGYSLDDLYKGLSVAETGSYPNPWIRTAVRPKGGSTAFGPVQLTHTTADDFLKRHPRIRKAHADYWNKTFNPQGLLFKRYGAEPDKKGYDQRYDYYKAPDKAQADNLRRRIMNTGDPAAVKALRAQLDALNSRGTGLTHTADDKESYGRLAKDIMGAMIEEARLDTKSEKFLDSFLTRWRGKDPGNAYRFKVWKRLNYPNQ